MTFPVHWTPEERREAQRLKMSRYRERHRDQFRAYDQKRRAKRQELRTKRVFEGRKCRLCDIFLDTPLFGAKGTKIHCLSCSKDIKTINRLRMRAWRKQNAKKQLHKAHNEESKERCQVSS